MLSVRIVVALVWLATSACAFYTHTTAGISAKCSARVNSLGSFSNAGSMGSEDAAATCALSDDAPDMAAVVTQESSFHRITHQQHQFRSGIIGVFRRCALMSTVWLTAVTSNLSHRAAAADTSTATSDAELQTSIDFADQVERTRPLNSDEFRITFSGQSLDLRLSETYYKGFPIVTVKQIMNSQLSELNPELREGVIVIQINDAKVDGKPLSEMVDLVKQSPRPLVIKFRDPSRFFQQLDSTAGPPRRVVSTSYLPANARDAGATEQKIVVERLALPVPSLRTRAAQLLDVMEIQYVAQLQSDDDPARIVDSSAQRSAPGSSAKSIYYILGQQNGPPGKFPQGWDLTLMGMVVGEKRRITLPYTLAYDRKGNKELGIPPFAAMVYTVKLLSLT